MVWVIAYVLISALLIAIRLPLRWKYLGLKHLLLLPTLPVLILAVIVVLTDELMMSIWYEIKDTHKETKNIGDCDYE